MHLADGTLSNQVCTVTAAMSCAAVAFAMTRAPLVASPARLLRAGLAAALVFAAQAVDVPTFIGLPAHMIGAAFLVLVAGPALALLAMTLVLIVQALVLNDGGVTTLGANVLNMGVVGVAVAAWTLRRVSKAFRGRNGALIGLAAASAASVLAAVVAMGIELEVSGTSSDVAGTMVAHAPFVACEMVLTTALALVLTRVLPASTRPRAAK